MILRHGLHTLTSDVPRLTPRRQHSKKNMQQLAGKEYAEFLLLILLDSKPEVSEEEAKDGFLFVKLLIQWYGLLFVNLIFFEACGRTRKKMPNNQNLKAPPPTKKVKTEDVKPQGLAKVPEKQVADVTEVTEAGEVPAEEEFFDFEVIGSAASPARQKEGGGFKKLVEKSALTESGQKKKPSKVLMKAMVVRGVGVFIGMDKGNRPDVYPEKYMKDLVVGSVQIEGGEDFLTENAVLREVRSQTMSMSKAATTVHKLQGQSIEELIVHPNPDLVMLTLSSFLVVAWQVLDRHDNGVKMLYTGKDGNLYSRRVVFCAIDAHPKEDKDKIVAMLEEIADLINQHPERPLSQFPESNKAYVDPEDCIIEVEKSNDICGFGGTLRVIALYHPKVVQDRRFGQEQAYIMCKFFRKGSMSVSEVRHIGASSYYASPEAVAELRKGALKKGLVKKIVASSK